MMGGDDPCNADAADGDRNGRVEDELVTVAHALNVALRAIRRVLPQE
jgi:hypothetical protein